MQVGSIVYPRRQMKVKLVQSAGFWTEKEDQ